MKVFTFYYNRYTDATTSKALYENGIDHYVMLHNAEDKHKFIKGNTIFGTPVVTDNPKGLAFQRNSALDMVEDGEWCVFMCDDFKMVKAFNYENYMDLESPPFDMRNQAPHRYKQTISLSQMFYTFPYLIALAETANIHLIGFAFNDNPRNNQRKFGHKGLVDGRFWLIKKSSLRFDTNAQLIDDVAWTALNLKYFKNNLVFNWIDPEFDRYTKGGFGTIEERIEQRRSECAYLVKKFPTLIQYAQKAGWPPGTHIKIKNRGDKLKLVERNFFQQLV